MEAIILQTLLFLLFGYILNHTLPRYAEKIVDTHFDKKIADYKSQIEFENKRLFADFGAYSKKRHRVYPKLYKLVLMAEDRVNYLYERSGKPTFEDFNTEDLKKYLDIKRFTSQKKDEVIALWSKNDKEAAKQIIEMYEDISDENNVTNSIRKLRRYFEESRLYLSNEIEQTLDETCDLLGELYGRKNRVFAQFHLLIKFQQGQSYASNEEIAEKIQKNIGKMKEQMKKELARGDYTVLN